MNTELLEKFKELCSKEISLSEVCRTLKLNSFQVLSLVNELRNSGINIVTKMFDDDIYMFNNGEREVTEEYSYNLKTDNKGEIYISNLIPGTYYLKETNTKDGYIIQENLIEFAVKLNQKLTITVNNSLEEKPEINIEEKEMEATVIKKLPKTGM